MLDDKLPGFLLMHSLGLSTFSMSSAPTEATFKGVDDVHSRTAATLDFLDLVEPSCLIIMAVILLVSMRRFATAPVPHSKPDIMRSQRPCSTMLRLLSAPVLRNRDERSFLARSQTS